MNGLGKHGGVGRLRALERKSNAGRGEWRKKLIRACTATPVIYSATIIKLKSETYTLFCAFITLILKTWV